MVDTLTPLGQRRETVFYFQLLVMQRGVTGHSSSMIRFHCSLRVAPPWVHCRCTPVHAWMTKYLQFLDEDPEFPEYIFCSLLFIAMKVKRIAIVRKPRVFKQFLLTKKKNKKL